MNWKYPRNLKHCIIYLIIFTVLMTSYLLHSFRKDGNNRVFLTLSDSSTDKQPSRMFHSIPNSYENIGHKHHWNFKPIIVENVNCKALISGENNSRLIDVNSPRKAVTPEEYIYMTKNCYNFKRERSYITTSLTPEEEAFPIAFAIVVYKDVSQVENLLRAIYRPQNIYCFHVDRKSEKEFFDTLSAIVDCFPNVFIAKTSVDVRWGQFSLLETQLICMKELSVYKQWKYFINLSGQEFPLKTNYEMVQILKAYNGTNDVKCPWGLKKYWAKVRWSDAGDPPHGITPHKGPLMVTVNRQFVDYVLNDRRAKDFLNWTKYTQVPDETFFPSLHFNTHLGIPGSQFGKIEHDSSPHPRAIRYFARFVRWNIRAEPCNRTVHSICIFGAGDLPKLVRRPELFANKFFTSYQPVTLECLQEWLYNKTRENFLDGSTLNTDVYKNKNVIPERKRRMRNIRKSQ